MSIYGGFIVIIDDCVEQKTQFPHMILSARRNHGLVGGWKTYLGPLLGPFYVKAIGLDMIRRKGLKLSRTLGHFEDPICSQRISLTMPMPQVLKSMSGPGAAVGPKAKS